MNDTSGTSGNLIPSNNALLTYLSSFIISDSISRTDWSDGFKPFDNTKFPNSKGRFVKLDGLSKMRVNEEYGILSIGSKRAKRIAREKYEEIYEQYKEHINSGDVIFKAQTSTQKYRPNFTVDKEIIIKNKLTFSEANDLLSNSSLLRLTVKGAIPSSTTPSPNIPQDLSSSGPKEVFVMNYVDEEEGGEFSVSSYYMRLGHLLQYINNTIIPIEKNTDEKIIKINTDQFSSNRMYKFPFQHSHNPRVCLVRSSYPIGLDKTTTPNTVEYQKALSDLPLWFKKGNDYAYLMNIYINFQQIQSSINDNLDEEDNLSLFDFLSSLCTAINKALGGVNNLEPTIDEETNTIRIIDGSYTSEENKPATDYALELYGYNTPTSSSNFVRNFSVKSTVSKEYASMVSIGATAAGYTKGMEATMFSKWNTGITDRFKEEYVPNNEETPPTGSANEAVRNYITEVLLKDLSRNEKKDGGFFLDTELINSQVNFATEFYKYCQYQFQQKNPKYGSPIIGFVPINLNLSMDGISGMKIYNVVRTSTRFLPKNYTDSLRFLTTSINHKLSNNDWETSIDTVVIPENYDKEGEAIILPYLERVKEVERILRECVDLLTAPKTSRRASGVDVITSAPLLPSPTSIGSGDKIRVDADLTTPWIKNPVDGKAKGAYRYLQIITKTPKTGAGQYYKIPGTTAFITSGFGQRDVPSGTHQAIDIAAGGKLPQTCPFQKGKIIQQIPNNYGIIKIQELNPTTNKPTGRYARFLHSNYFGFNQGDIVKFNDIVGKEGRAGKNNPLAYGIHSHFELTLTSNSSKVTVDNKRAVKYPSGKLPGWFIAPTIEEIKCAHGLSNTPLPLPEVSTKNGVTNYKCIF